MNAMLEAALNYAAVGWPVFRLSKAKVPLKGSHGHLDATLDPTLIREWWDVPKPPNIGLACGPIVVLDFDGPESVRSPWGASLMAAANGGFPQTAMVATKRGVHFYFTPPAGVIIRTKNEPRTESGAPGVDLKAQGGYVVGAPSTSKGFTYNWANSNPVLEMPPWLVQWVEQLGGLARQKAAVSLPEHLKGRVGTGLTARAKLTQEATPDDIDRIRSALAALPADGYDVWYQVGMALYSTGWERSDGSSPAFDIFDEWSASVPDKYSPGATEDKWRSFATTARGEVTLGTLFHLAKQVGWEAPIPQRVETIPAEMRAFSTPQPAQSLNDRIHLNGHSHAAAPGPLAPVFVQKSPDNPLIELNEKYSVIGDVGGKCLVLGWVQSKVDKNVKVPSFQAFRAFSERFSARYIQVHTTKPNGDIIEEAKQLGTYWLKWTGRKSFEAIDLVPNANPVLEGNILNLWSGFAVEPVPGEWPLMQRHIFEVLADNDTDSAAYIMRFAAWALQNPGKRAEAALVFRGDKGSGKSTFANALKTVFGQHGLQVFSSKHMVGNFNSHLRNCLLLFADEAFWAGDKQGESTLKGLITEPTLIIEQKGVDATPWTNRLKIIMAANADWVVPAGPMERRYAVFNVSPKQIGNQKYFDALHEEMANGGMAAMVHALMNLDLGKWHPRQIVKTAGLSEQKQRSLNVLQEWYEGVLQDGKVPGSGTDPRRAPAVAIMHGAVADVPKMRDISATALGRFLRDQGCIKMHEAHGNAWKFPELAEARQRWEKAFGGSWAWQEELEGWRGRA